MEQAVVQGARTILRGEQGALLLPPIREGESASRLLSTGDELLRTSVLPSELAADLRILLPEGSSRLYVPGEPLPGWLAEIGVKDAAIVPLSRDGVVAGAIVIATRPTEVRSFVAEDTRVITNLPTPTRAPHQTANHAP